jgi:aryl-alcohol dehydrogenase-like predicted oxidoreductase
VACSPFGGLSGVPPTPALALAERYGVSVHRVLLAWLRAQSANIVPLAGASRPASIRDSATLLDLMDYRQADWRITSSGSKMTCL